MTFKDAASHHTAAQTMAHREALGRCPPHSPTQPARTLKFKASLRFMKNNRGRRPGEVITNS